MKRAALATAAVAVVVGSLVAVSAGPSPSPSAAPSSAVRFPTGFGTPIYVGNTQVWPTTTTTGGATSTSTSNPATTTATTSAPTTSSTSPTSTGAPTTTPTTTIPSTTDPSTTATSVAASTTAPTTTTTPAPTTSAPSATTTTTTPNPAACGLPNAAFCDTFDQPYPGTKTQTGDLDPTLWGVSRVGDLNPQAIVNGISPSHNACTPTAAIYPPADVRICNGQLVESINDGGSVVGLDMYPKQPFYFAGRTGTIVFDVSADSDDGHAAWPEFLITDKPVPGVHGSVAGAPPPYAQNEVGFTIDGEAGCNTSGKTGLGIIFQTVAGVYSETKNPATGCITKGSADAMNHFEVHVSQTRLDVYATNPGTSTLVHLGAADLTITFSQGLVWMNDVHYNARKGNAAETGTQFDHSFTWDNFGFDGPKTYRDWGFDVPYANKPGGLSVKDDREVNEGYQVNPSVTLTIAGVDKGAAADTAARAGALLVFNADARTAATVNFTLNGHVLPSYPIPVAGYWQSAGIEVPSADVLQGTNTLVVTANDGSTVVSNVSLILVAAAQVP